MNNSPSDKDFDSQTLLNQIVIEYRQEQKRKRQWRWVKRIGIIIAILFALYFVFFSDDDKGMRAKSHVGLIDVNGNISDGQAANAENFAKGLEDAYQSKGLKSLIIRINSPGGSPVQADYMYNTLQHYRKKYPSVKTYAVCVDMCTSAAYYIAVAADEIYANPSSIVGSIGVLYNGFGFVDAMQKVGVSRRLQTAGVYKAILDPFTPVSPEQGKFLQTILDDIHHLFIDRVKEGRGSRLKIDNFTFSGLFWTGRQAMERGLIDGFASSGELARENIKLDQLINYTNKPSLFERVAKNIGTAVADQLPLALGMKEGIKE